MNDHLPDIHPIPTVPVTVIQSAVPVRRIPVVGHHFCGHKRPPTLTGRVELLPEPSNPSDPDAVAVVEDGVKVGYVARTHLNWVHALLTGHLTHLREADGMHADELSFPLLLTLVELDDLGNLYGALLVVGISDTYEVVDGTCTLVQPVVPDRHPNWKVELVGGGVRICRYSQSVSEAIVRSYASRKGWIVSNLSPSPDTTNV